MDKCGTLLRESDSAERMLISLSFSPFFPPSHSLNLDMMTGISVTILDPEITMRMRAMSWHIRAEGQEESGLGRESTHHPWMTIPRFLLQEGE